MTDTNAARWEAYSEAGRQCFGDKQFEKAEEAFLAALRAAEQFGDDDPRLAASLNNLARAYCRRDKYFPAAALLHRLLGIKEREMGDTHPELAGVVTNLAEMYMRLGDARQELSLRERALAVRTANGDTPDSAILPIQVRIDHLRHKLTEEKAATDRGVSRPVTGTLFRKVPDFAATPESPAHPIASQHAGPRGPLAPPLPASLASVLASPPVPATPAPVRAEVVFVIPQAVDDVSAELDAFDDVVHIEARRSPRRMQVFGGLAAAGLLCAAVLVGRGMTGDAATPAEAAARRGGVDTAAGSVTATVMSVSEEEARQIGLASINGNGTTTPAQLASTSAPAPLSRSRTSGAAAAVERPETDETPDTTGPRRAEQLGISMPNVNLDGISKSIEKSARAGVDSMTRAAQIKAPTFRRSGLSRRP